MSGHAGDGPHRQTEAATRATRRIDALNALQTRSPANSNSDADAFPLNEAQVTTRDAWRTRARKSARPHRKTATYYSGEWYPLGPFGDLRITIGYYVDALTVTMFCMVTLIASCIHFYAMGYMHDELHEPSPTTK